MDINEYAPTPDSSDPFGTRSAEVLSQSLPTRPSVLGIISMIAGVVSPFLCCLCYFSIFSSITAIITGHLSLAEINRSAGRVTGKAFAITGLAIGYPMLLVTLCFIGFAAYSTITRGVDIAETELPSSSVSSSGRDALHDAEMKILGDSQGTTHGNTAEAEALAVDFSERMKTLRETLFTDDERKLQITGGEFLTYCELHEDRALFLVHVPAYRDFEADAKDQLAALAWTTSQNVVEDTLLDGDRLAVGMKGTFLYGAVMVGAVGSDEPESNGTDQDALIEFFPDEFAFDYGTPIPLGELPDEQESTETIPDDHAPGETEPIAKPDAADRQ